MLSVAALLADVFLLTPRSSVSWARGPKTGELGVEVGHVVGKGPEYPITKPYKIGSGVSGSHVSSSLLRFEGQAVTNELGTEILRRS